MARTTVMIALALVLPAAGGCASSEPASAKSASDGVHQSVALGVSSSSRAEGDEARTLGQCPAAVQDTIKAHLNGGTIKEIERTTDHGEVLYEVDVRGAGGVVEFDVAEDGTFRGFEAGDDDGDGPEDEDDDGDEDDDDEGDDDDDD